METMFQRDHFLQCRVEKARQIIPLSCFPVDSLPLHFSHPPGRAVQNKSLAPVTTTPLPAAFQAIFHPLAQQHYPLNEHKSFSLLIFNETQTDPLH